jgi:hypothetical protein
MAKLPKEREQKLIAEMEIDELGYTVPWAMWADENRDLYIDLHFPVVAEGEQGGTACMLIRRVDGGFKVYEHTIGDYQYNLSKRDGTERANLPVLELA